MRLVRKFVYGAGAVAVGLVTTLSMAPTAEANTAYGCVWPRVCIYKDASVTSQIIGRYQDAGYWQRLSNPESGYAIFNSRNDDVVYLRNSNGSVFCVKPNSSGIFARWTITQIYIDPLPYCR